jgi:hypothetical protein
MSPRNEGGIEEMATVWQINKKDCSYSEIAEFLDWLGYPFSINDFGPVWSVRIEVSTEDDEATAKIVLRFPDAKRPTPLDPEDVGMGDWPADIIAEESSLPGWVTRDSW